jgi:serine/threonine-protein kinase HSL1 (negative regulator of Swe1 kinase)
MLTFCSMNYEKYFYTALQKYQQDQLENYMPQHAVAYSKSDYHHNKRLSPTSQTMQRLPSKRHKRSQSGYSILNDEHLYSEHSFYEPPPSSEASYDPFRASKDPIVPTQSLHQNITVHRGSSGAGRSLRPATALGHHTRSTLRVQVMTRNSKQGSAASRGSSKRSTPSSNRSVQSGRRRSISRSSMMSSQYPSSPPVFRPQSMHRRGVSFSHLRRASVATASTAEASTVHYTPEQRRYLSGGRGSVASSMAYSSPLSPRPSTVGDSPTVRQLTKVAAIPMAPRLRVRKADSPSKYIQSEVRKVSTELGKVMEEAFNRSSISSVGTSAARDGSEYDTPPTSFSNRDSGGTTTLVTPNNKAVIQNRPLPPVPNETPNSFLHRKLAETRSEIARRLQESGDSNTEHFQDVLRHLDSLMEPSTTASLAKRIASAPNKSSDPSGAGLLQVIPEEGKDSEARFEPLSSSRRAVTDPARPNLNARRALTEQHSIRLVDQSPTRIEPLNIRKRSVATSSTKDPNDHVAAVPWPGPTSNQGYEHSVSGSHSQRLMPPNSTSTEVPDKKESTIKKKKSSWFRRNPEERQQETQLKAASAPLSLKKLDIPEAWQGLDDRISNDPHKGMGPSPDLGRAAIATAKASDKSTISEFPMRNCGTALSKSEGGGAFKGFLNFFGKKSKEEKGKHSFDLGGMRRAPIRHTS